MEQGAVGLVTKFGRYAQLTYQSPEFEFLLTCNLSSLERAVDPGLVKVNPLSERLTTVDVKIQIVEVPRQVCMTKDNVTLNLTSVIYYHVTMPHKAAFGVVNVKQALVERTQTTLRHVVGARVLQDVIERREEIAQSIGEIIEEVATGWGVQVESMLIKDIIFSNDLQDSLSMAAQSKRIGESKVIAARAEVESAKLMRQVCESKPYQTLHFNKALTNMCLFLGRRYPLLCTRHADPLPRGHASHGQDCQQQSHFSARKQPDHPAAHSRGRERWRRPEQIRRGAGLVRHGKQQ